MALNEQTGIDGIRTLFEIEEIKRIICVDDNYRKFQDTDVSYLRARLKYSDYKEREQLSKRIEKFHDIIWENDVAWENQLTQMWDASDKKEREELTNQINEIIGKDNSTEMDNKYSSLLKDKIKPLGVELEELSYSEWKEKYGPWGENLLGNPGQEKALFLIDKDLSKESGCSPDQGVRIIEKLLENDKDNKLMCGLWSHTIKSKTERDEWMKIARDYDIDQDRLVLISKENLESNHEDFFKRLRLPIISKYCKELKNQASSVLDTASKKSIAEINDLDFYDFEDSIFRSSYNEGAWEINTLFRLYNIHHKYFFRNEILNNSDLSKITDKIRQINQTMDQPNDDSKKLWKTLRLEYYEDEKHVNCLQMPIESGDIFENYKKDGTPGKKYILLAQPCDLMVRAKYPNKGKRARDFHEGILFEIDNKPGEDDDSSYELKYFDEDSRNSMYINFKKKYHILLCILDLCVFNVNGVSQMSSNEEYPINVIPAWQYRFEKLKEKFDRTTEEYNKYLKIFKDGNCKGIDEGFLKKHLLPKSSHYGTALFKPSITIKKNITTIEYNCRRVGRLCKQHAESAWLKYSHLISRKAFDHDFTASGKDEEKEAGVYKHTNS